ncbi:MAG: hypothetical protein H6699_04230 [Myxococcales bacterium]|nr:hypothetical protein [Myxococcales bacterium]
MTHSAHEQSDKPHTATLSHGRWLLAALAWSLLACSGDTNGDGSDTDDASDVTTDAPADVDADGGVDSDAGPDGAADVDDAAEDAADSADVDDAEVGPPAWPAPYPAANAVSADDPRYEGQAQFLYDTWGTEVLGQWPPAEFLVGLQTSEPEVFGDQFSAFGWIPDPARDLPVGLARGRENPELVHETCAACHTAVLPDGRVWFGAPARQLDYDRFRVAVNERWVAAGNPSLLNDTLVERVGEYGRGRTSVESSSFATPVPADFPAYYDLGMRTALNHLGTGRNVRSEAYFSIFAFGAGDPNDEEAVVPFPTDEQTAPFLEFFGSLSAPEGPEVDADDAARGAVVFEEARCGTCHHVDDPAADGITPVDMAEDGLERYPGDDEAWPRGSIRTSFAHRALIDGDGSGGGDEGRGDLIAFIFRHLLSVRDSDGYRVSYLRGLWSSAPYLHNGSVPTLDDLLRPAAERPTTFENFGYELDTTRPWNTNRGHEFGTDLSDDDRAALVAYLLSL